MNPAKPGAEGLSDGREAAYLAVLDVLCGRGFAAERLSALRSAGGLSGREAGLAMQIGLGAVRHAITIEHVLSAVAQFDPQRTQPESRAILYAAAYQIIWTDRIPIFAAVDQAVTQARRHVGGRTPGMVNAVLRNLGRAIADRRAPWQRLDRRHVRVSWDEACVFQREVLPPAEPPERVSIHLAAATGERRRRYAALVARYGADAAEQIAWAAQAVPVIVLQRNSLRLDPDEFQAQMRAAFGEQVELTPDAAFLSASVRVMDAPVFVEGAVFVQDPTAHAAARLVVARPGERVLDLCAAPGGKSVVLAMQMQDRGEVLACDASPERLARVEENVARLGLTCVRAGPPPVDEPEQGAAATQFDAALLDVPCSNTGVIARRPEARLGLTAKKLQSLVRAQRDLLELAAGRVRPGGRLVYSTCSLEPEENQRQVEWFLTEHPDWELDCQQTTLPAWGPRLSDWRDGGYAARLRLRADHRR